MFSLRFLMFSVENIVLLKVFKFFQPKAWKTYGKSIFSLKIFVFLKIFNIFQPKTLKTLRKTNIFSENINLPQVCQAFC